jgi:hydrogenase expression/formation protein HypC
MCLGLPMQVVAVDGFRARCAVRGVEREVSLLMLQEEPVAVGDFVMVHLGHALEKMTAEQAHSTWQLYDEALGAEQLEAET